MFKILSIDGGGIKGIYSASLIAYLENHYDKQVADCFDLISGTSTGGILGIALANRIPAKNIVQFYEKWGDLIFSYKPWSLYNLLRRFEMDLPLFRSKYNNEILTKALKEVFEENTLSDILVNEDAPGLCIPTIEAITGTPKIFKTPHHESLWHDANYKLWEVALATSAAPMFFPFAVLKSPFLGTDELFIDGGLYANNPGLVGLTEALQYFDKKVTDIGLFSVGNIKASVTFRSNTSLRKGILLWRTKIVTMTMESQAKSVDNILKLLFENHGVANNYLRVESVALQNQNNLTKIDCTTKSNIDDLINSGVNKAKEICNNPLITNLFK